MTDFKLTHAKAKLLRSLAQQACDAAYAPYSGFPVGAVVLCSDGKKYTGVNIENASYGLTICAERVAISKAVSEGRRDLMAIAVWASENHKGVVTPCGACRQVMAEFFQPEALVLMGESETSTLSALLPMAFSHS